MSKHIDAEAFKRRILSYGIVHEGDRIQIPFYKRYFAEAYVAILRWVCEEVDDTPAADVQEVRHGRWIMHIDDLFPEESTMECDQCHEEQPLECDDKYCPSCGAQMSPPDKE